MNITPSHIMVALALLGGLLGVIGYFQRSYTSTDLAAIKDRLVKLETKVDLYWGAVERQMSQMLHSPHRPRLDKLLDKNARNERLSDEEAEQLIDLLGKLIESKELSGNEEAGARMLIAVTIAKYELKD